VEREGPPGYPGQCRGLYIQATSPGLSEDTENGAAEIVFSSFYSLI